MKKENAKNSDHQWACVTKTGSLGEIIKKRQLSDSEVKLIVGEKEKLAEVCQGGSVICSHCNVTFEGSPLMANPLADVSQIRKLLRRN